MKITVAGMGYVGMANAVLLAQHNEVIAYDVLKEKVELINQKISPIQDEEIELYLKEKVLNLKATTNLEEAFNNSDYVIISTPTNYDEDTNYFDTSLVEKIVQITLEKAPKATMIIKSTIPIGLTKELSEKYNTSKLFFSPEFLREGKALYDNLYPSRIIVGGKTKEAENFAKLMVEGAIKEDIDVLFVGPTEAEAIKLFANTYLAMRVAYFNELDSFAEIKNLNSLEIIKGVSLDPRIGNHYNNPSFGYGGYCLPKDTKQMLSSFRDTPQNLMSAIIEANTTRKNHVVKEILKRSPKIVGIYRLVMKTGSDNFRESAVYNVIKKLIEYKVEVIIYEPELKNEDTIHGKLINNLEEFLQDSDLIIANRTDENLESFKHKVYSRDIFHDN
jgi:UDPglucose 6-dehydrogenase